MAKKERSLAWMIAKPFIGLCLPLCISIGLMFYMSGKSLSPSSFIPGFAQSYFNSASEVVSSSISQSSLQQVYKWKDKEGVWHFSETAPAEVQSKEYESYTVSSDITTIQMPKPKPVEEAPKNNRGQGFIIRQETDKMKETSDLASDPMELINQAKAIAEQMKQRNSSLEGM